MRKALISGAGIAGSTAAYWLAKSWFSGHGRGAGARNPVQRQPGRRPRACGGGRRADGRHGADPRGEHAACATWCSSTREAASSAASTCSTWAEPGDVELSRGDLAAILRDAVPDEVEIQFGNTVSSLEQDADGVTAEFTCGPPRRFDVVIGADGAHSGVRALAFGPESEYVTHLGVYVATLPLDGETGSDLVMYNTPGRAVAIHPARRSRSRRSCSARPRSPSSTIGISTSTSGCCATRMQARAGACPSCWTASAPRMTCISTRSAGCGCRRGRAGGGAGR